MRAYIENEETTMTKQQMIEGAIGSAVASLESDWEDEFQDRDGGKERFIITIKSQDETIFAEETVDFER